MEAHHSPALLTAVVGHTRHRPRHHTFSYNVFYVLTEVTSPNERLPALFSRNALNLFARFDRDHGPKDGTALAPWVLQQFFEHRVPVASLDRVFLLAHPRMANFVFNPISFWLLVGSDNALKGVLCEVRNTFGDYHNYVLAHPDGRAILPSDIFSAQKNLFVSPFNPLEGSYEFSFTFFAREFKAHITYFEQGEKTVSTFMGGTFSPLSSRALLGAFFRYPLMTLGVVANIHFQAFRLILKGVSTKLHLKPKRERGRTTAAE